MNAALASTLRPFELEYAASLWPKRCFATESKWLAYVEKWYPIITKKK